MVLDSKAHSQNGNAGYRCIFLVFRHNGKLKGETKTSPLGCYREVKVDRVQNGLHRGLPILGTRRC